MNKPQTPLAQLKRAQRHITLAQQAIDAVIATSTDPIAVADMKTARADLKCAVGRIKGIEKRMEEEAEKAEKQAVLNAVEIFVIDRFSTATPDPNEFDEDDLERMVTDKNGYLEFTVEQMKAERGQEDHSEWYVEATLFFDVSSGEPVKGTTDTYLAYRGADGEWIIDWHSS